MLAGEFSQLSLFAFAVLNLSVSEPIQQAIRTFSDLPEPAMRAWNYMMTTFQPQDSTNQILLADKLSRFRQRPNEDLEEYINRGKALQVQLNGVNTPLSEASLCVYLVKGLTNDSGSPPTGLHASAHPNGGSCRHRPSQLHRGTRTLNNRQGETDHVTKPCQCRQDASQDPQGGSPSLTSRLQGQPKKPFSPRKGPPKNGDRSLLICYSCKQSGHPWTMCPTKKSGYQPTDNDKQAASAIRKMKIQQKGDSGTYVTPKERSSTPRALVAQVHQCQLSAVGRRKRGVWLLDSGCSTHMTFDRSAFRNLRALDKEVEILVGNNVFITAEGIGDIPLRTPQGNIVLTDVLLVPELSSNLVSYTRLMRRGCTIVGTPDYVNVYEPAGGHLLTANHKSGMLQVNARAAQVQEQEGRNRREEEAHRVPRMQPKYHWEARL